MILSVQALPEARPSRSWRSLILRILLTGVATLGLLVLLLLLFATHGFLAVCLALIVIVLAGVWRAHDYRFGLLTLLLLLTVFCVYMGLKVNYETKRERAISQAMSLGGSFKSMDRESGFPWSFWLDRYQLTFDSGNASLDDDDLTHLEAFAPSALWGLNLGNTGITDAGLKHIKKLRGLEWLSLQNQYVPHVTVGRSLIYRQRNRITDDGLKELSSLTHLTYLSLGGTDITDDGLRYLSQMSSLGGLYLQGTNVTGHGFSDLRQLKYLIILYLDGCSISKDGFRELSHLKNLQCLGLKYTTLTDDDLALLHNLVNLTTLDVYGAEVTDEGLRELSKALPNCQINR